MFNSPVPRGVSAKLGFSEGGAGGCRVGMEISRSWISRENQGREFGLIKLLNPSPVSAAGFEGHEEQSGMQLEHLFF